MKTTRHFSVRAVGAAVLLVLTTIAAASPAAAGWYSDRQAVVALANEARAWEGVGPLWTDGHLQYLAQSWADELAAGGYLAHNPDLPWMMGDWWAWGENVGYGPSVGAIHEGWTYSWAHYANLVAPAFGSIGVGVAYDEWGWMYVVQVFGG